MDPRLWIVLTFSLCGLTESQNAANSGTNSDCGQVIVKAEARTKYATTPGYPVAFPGDAKCIWAIYCEAGKRIRLEFKKFSLLEPIAGECEYHYVIIKSPFTLFSMGPYCGEMGLPTIVSTGNLIYVELHTLVPVTTDNYQGFKLAFKVTSESSSYELRADNMIDDPVMTIDPDTMNMLSPTMPTTTSPRPTKTTTRPWRFVPSRRPLNNINNRPIVRAPVQRVPSYVDNNIQPPSRRTIIVKPKANNETPIRIEIIVGIAVGGVVAVAIIVMIAFKMMSRKGFDERRSNGENRVPPPPTAGGTATKDEHLPFPSMYPDPNQQYFHNGVSYVMAPMYANGMPIGIYPPNGIVEENHNRKTNRVKRKRRRRRQ